MQNIKLTRLTNKATQIRISEIYERVKNGKLILQPPFQRYYVWNDKMASELIYSLLRNIDIKTVYTVHDIETGLEEVIDGQQRLTSIVRFIDNEFTLQVQDNNIVEVQNCLYRSFPEYFKNVLLMTDIRVISYSSTDLEDIMNKFQLFVELNKGAKQLNCQEIRNCIFCGEFNDFCKKMADNTLFRIVFGKYNKRMLDIEMVLRFFADIDNKLKNWDIQRSLTTYMSQSTEKLKGLNDNEKREYYNTLEKRFLHGLNASIDILGKDAFRESGKRNHGKWLPNFFIGFMRIFQDYEMEDLMDMQTELRNNLIKLTMEKSELFKGHNSRTQQSYLMRMKVISDCINKTMKHKKKNLLIDNNKVKELMDKKVNHDPFVKKPLNELNITGKRNEI